MPYVDWALFAKVSIIGLNDSVMSNEKLSPTNNTCIPFEYNLKAVRINFRFNFIV